MINHYTVKIGENTFPVEFFDFERIEKMPKKTWFWTSFEDDEAIAVYESEQAHGDHSDPRCPRCNERSNFDEGQIDEDFMGNAIRGWWYVCWGCGLSTQAIEGRYDESEY